MEIATFKTSDGFKFHLLDDGSVVDNLDPDCVDMSWASLEAFVCDLMDEIQAHRLMINFLANNQMTLIQKAHYAMDNGTLNKSPGTATKAEIESAFMSALLSNMVSR